VYQQAHQRAAAALRSLPSEGVDGFSVLGWSRAAMRKPELLSTLRLIDNVT
jgi:hypothetical protein